MYSPEVVQRRLHAAKKEGMLFRRLPRLDSIDIAGKLEALRLDKNGKALPDGNLSRPPTRQEEDFIRSEQVICKMDFEYFFTRYCALERDPGVGRGDGIGPPILLESQQRYLTLFGRREEVVHAEVSKYGFTAGILAYLHKVRQVSATAFVRGMTMHRMIFWKGTRALCCGLDDDGKGELFKRDHLILDNLPWWLKPKIYPDVKDTELGFEPPLSSRIYYRAENAESGFGTGTQNDVSHLTEVGLYNYAGRIRFSFVPSIPKAATTLHVQESTSNGKGNYWHEVTEQARKGRKGYEDWIYAFIPWYMNKSKYRANVPDSWTPDEHTQRHADLIERTSPEFFDGKTIRPNRDQLYWWESARAQHAANGELASFLTNYPATPEQSFQSPSQGALPVEILEIMEQEVMYPGCSYEPETVAA
jgi:hypothetical protein